MTRHEMRRNVFMLCFERAFHNDSADSIIEAARECETVEIDEKTEEWFREVDLHTEELDTEIEKYLKNWTISRISKVTLAVLRVAMYEIMFKKEDDISIPISEAVKIAQEFSGKEDVSFVNGLLSSVAKDNE